MAFMRLAIFIAICSMVVPFAAHGTAGQKSSQSSAFSERLSGSEKIAQALDRLTFGPRPGDSEEVQRIGLRKWVEWQLHPERIAENALLVSKLKPYASLSMKPRDLFLDYPSPREVRTDLASAKILRAIYSERQLQEEMVDFWFNHFNIYFNKGADRYLTTGYEREAIRPHVFGKFYDLLLATAKSPAMLFYLDNAESVAPNSQRLYARNARKQEKRGLNENYGRELMELHTLGVTGGYTQRDVIEVARCFTGWTISPPRRGGEFRFNPRLHDFGPKIVLGHAIHAGGDMSDGLEVLKILANSPATARHISLELATRFVADNPPPALVERMTATHLRTHGDIRAVLETMIFSPEFFSKGAYRAKVKTPFEMVVSAVRASGADIESPLALDRQIARLGEPLYLKIEPTGYSNNNAEWMNTASLLGRMNFALALAKNHIPGVSLPANGGEQLAATLGSPGFQRH